MSSRYLQILEHSHVTADNDELNLGRAGAVHKPLHVKINGSGSLLLLGNVTQLKRNDKSGKLTQVPWLSCRPY